ncbi:hypothetical protein, partial [Motilibacter rhizosphaerae]|uniref:hypothetical protein n=1 Tax=Motilibacter rhizosphaerae TaxID=598652 RepID=UPI001E2BE56F
TSPTTATITVRGKIALTSKASTLTLTDGDPVTFTGTVANALTPAGIPMQLQQQTSTGWTTIATTTTDTTGTGTFTQTPHTTATYRITTSATTDSPALPANATYTVTVSPRATLGLTASASAVRSGTSVVVKAVLARTSTLAGVQVWLQQQGVDGLWITTSTGTTDTNGVAKWVITPRGSAAYRAVTADGSALTSSVVAVTVTT